MKAKNIRMVKTKAKLPRKLTILRGKSCDSIVQPPKFRKK